MHETERVARVDPGRALAPPNDRGHERPNLIRGALGTTTEVLAGKFSNCDVSPESGVEVFHICDELISPFIIPMGSYIVDRTTLASSEEVLHPSYAVWVGGDRRRKECVALLFQRLHVLQPEVSRMLRGYIALSGFVRLIRAQSNVRITFNDKFLKLANLVVTPQHGHKFETELVRQLGFVGTPGVQTERKT